MPSTTSYQRSPASPYTATHKALPASGEEDPGPKSEPVRESDKLITCAKQPDFPVSANGSARPQANSPNREAGPCICQAGKSRVGRKRALYKCHADPRLSIKTCTGTIRGVAAERPLPSEQPTPPSQSTAGTSPSRLPRWRASSPIAPIIGPAAVPYDVPPSV